MEIKKIVSWDKVLLLLTFLILACTQQRDNSQVIASVEGHKIYLYDFRDRAELTIRPAFLKGANLNRKKLVLNALIAEKILAIRAQQDTQITNNNKLKDYVTGIKEQKMRQLHFKKFALDKVDVDSTSLGTITANANRSYDLSYFDVSGKVNVDSLADELEHQPDAFEKIEKHFYPRQKLQRQTVMWNDVVNSSLFDRLYRTRAEPSEIIGPVKRQDGRIFFFRVDGWKDNVLTSETDRRELQYKIKEQLKQQLATEKYSDVISELMAGRELVFNLQGLVPLINMLGPVFIGDKENFDFSNDPMHRFRENVALDSLARLTQLMKPVLKIDNRVWTIKDVLNEMKHHPLVFREKKFPKNHFGEQLKQAIADMIRDRYITNEAYKLGLDKTTEVKNTVTLWTDYFYALLMKEKMLKAKTDTTLNDIEYMDGQIRKLRSIYKNEITINSNLLSQTEITDVQFLAFQQNVPYPLVTPGFPMLTMDDR